MRQTLSIKTSNPSKTEHRSAASVHDASPQLASLQRKATLANGMGQCGLPIQRKTDSTNFEGYDNAYHEEIESTGTRKILKTLSENPDSGFPRLQFVDDYAHCGVIPEETSSAFQAKRVKIPNPEEHDEKSDHDYIGNLVGQRLMTRQKMNGMFAIHELEHLRVIDENKRNQLQDSKNAMGEPLKSAYVTGENEPYKNYICENLAKYIPANASPETRTYILKRLEYIKRPFPDKGNTDNDTAREFPSVLVELIYFCDSVSDDLSDFKAQLCGCYETLTHNTFNGIGG